MKPLQPHPSLLLILLVLLSGCQLLPEKKAPPAAADENRVEVARQLQAKGRYDQAIEVLERAIVEDGKAEGYTQTLREIRLQQTIVEQELHDQLLISRTSALKNQIPILEQLLRSGPENEVYIRQLNKTQQELQELRASLSDCGWRHFKKNNALAKDCLTLALSLEPKEQDERLMEFLLKQQKEHIEKTQTVEKAKRKQAWKHRSKQRMREAERFFESGQLTESRRVLKLLLKEDPRNAAAKKLLRRAERRLKSYVENLLAAGDRLYREGEIEGAKATWHAVLSLDPQEQRAREKIERAQRVLDNLENLRKSESLRP
jgi:tetratricopeptide (TPR) repeat protein